jgi:Na+/melibiose symporter-like transporter
MLTGVIQRHGDAGVAEGRYLGWWQVATKLNLALAAGLALPALQLFGYSAGTRSAEGLWALSVAYGILPCILKLLAAWRLWQARTHLWEKPHGE